MEFFKNLGFWTGLLYVVAFARVELDLLGGIFNFCRAGSSISHESSKLLFKLFSFPLFSYTPILLWLNLILFSVYGFLISKYLKSNLRIFASVLILGFLLFLNYFAFFGIKCVIY